MKYYVVCYALVAVKKHFTKWQSKQKRMLSWVVFYVSFWSHLTHSEGKQKQKKLNIKNIVIENYIFHESFVIAFGTNTAN